MDAIHALAPFLLLLPVAGAALLLLLGRSFPRPLIFAISCGACGAAFLTAVGVFVNLASLPPDHRLVIHTLWNWIVLPGMSLPAALQIDPLSTVMILVVTGVGFLIHLYSIGYMGEDPEAWRFFGLLNLFIFSMLTLVLAANVALLFVGWEGVGVCSWALISFWYTDPANATAGRKAFIVNRVGDAAMLAGVFTLATQTWGHPGSWNLDWVGLPAAVETVRHLSLGPWPFLSVVAVLVFLGACGKSSQFPLHIWLPDAMAGPTPVSALIHAATMVTAGIYLVGRMHVLFLAAPGALAVVGAVGAFTAIFAASIAPFQDDIKKVLAWSTISQLGFMFLALGTSGFSSAYFHLTTHAFFKASLFLGAGCVIVATHHLQDIRGMGGLRPALKGTYLAFMVCSLAMAGIPPLSGFFSKDLILFNVFNKGGGWLVLGVAGLTASLLTAFYMFRLIHLTFDGRWRGDHHHEPKHDAPRVMVAPVLILAGLAAVGGLLNLPLLGPSVGGEAMTRWLEPVFADEAPAHAGARPAESPATPALAGAGEPAARGEAPGDGHAAEAAGGSGGPTAGGHPVESAGHGAGHAGGHANLPLELGLMLLSTLVALGGITLARRRFGGEAGMARAAAPLSAFGRLASRQYRVEEFLYRIFVDGYFKLSALSGAFDAKVIDGLVNLTGRFGVLSSWLSGLFDNIVIDGLGVGGVSESVYTGGKGLRHLQTGRVQNYLVLALLGLLLIVAFKIL